MGLSKILVVLVLSFGALTPVTVSDIDITFPFTTPLSPPSGKDITDHVLHDHYRTRGEELFPVAYADWNSDKLTDIINVFRNRSSIQIYLSYKDSPLMRPGPLWHFKNLKNKEILSVTPGDFTGDGFLDLMVVFRTVHEFKHNLSTDCFHEVGNDDGIGSIPANVTVEGVELVFCFGDGGVSINCSFNVVPPFAPIVQEPIAIDLDGDMILDLVGEVWEQHVVNLTYPVKDMECNYTQELRVVKRRTIWVSDVGHPAARHHHFETKNQAWTNQFEMAYPSSNAYADVDGDFIPELLLITTPLTNISSHNVTKSSQVHYQRETYHILFHSQKSNGGSPVGFKLTSVIPLDLENHTHIIGQPLFIDLERKGELLHLIPFCQSGSSSANEEITGFKVINPQGILSSIAVNSLSYNEDNWELICPPRKENHAPFPIIPDKELSMETFYSRFLSFRVGDYNLDGYPDILAVLKTEHTIAAKRRTKAVVFENVPCISQRGKPCLLTRSFKPDFEFLGGYENVISASFFDLKEDGLPDVVLVRHADNVIPAKASNQSFELRFFQNDPTMDAYFLKVMVLTGRNCEEYPGSKDKVGVPYGVIIPGPLMTYVMTRNDGQRQTATACQMYRTANMPMDMPYSIFGIGQSPSYIDTLDINFRQNENSSSEPHISHQLIPNSQIIVIPCPLYNPWDWKVKLFLTPSPAVWNTFGVLMGIAAVVGAIVAGLEFKERREDRLIRMAEAHRQFMM